MKAVAAVLGVVILGAVAFGGCAFSTRNRIIALDEAANKEWSNVEGTYQRRLDLIPNLVSTVEGATKYEGATLERITEKRNQLVGLAQEMKKTIADPKQAERADQLGIELVGAIRAFTGVASEAYPNLKATEAFRDLMSQIEGTENRISVARRDYNEQVAAYNTLIRQWGWLPLCGGHKPRYTFKAAPEAAEAPKVNFKP